MPMTFAEILGEPIPPIEILDVGAMLEDGADRYVGLVSQGLAHVTGFEPNRQEFQRLSKRPGPYRYLPLFLGDGKEATFHITNYPGCSSLLEPNSDVIDLFQTMDAIPDFGNFYVKAREQVQTTRLDDVVPAVRGDLLKIDIQGAELMVLQNGRKVLGQTLVLETEAEFVPLYRDQPLFGDLHSFLRSQGFMLHKLIDCGGRPFEGVNAQNPFAPVSQLMWADAIFVRDFSSLEAYGDDDLIKAAAILHVVYQSYDLVALLLREHDRRQGRGLWSKYAAWLETVELPSTAVTAKFRVTTGRV